MRYLHKDSNTLFTQGYEIRMFIRAGSPGVVLPAVLTDAQLELFGIVRLDDKNPGQANLTKLECLKLLKESDWVMLEDSGVQNKPQWAAYRQLLRQQKLVTKPQLVYKTEPEAGLLDIDLQHHKLSPEFLADIQHITTAQELVLAIKAHSLNDILKIK